MFQFDAGNYADTLRVYGNEVLTLAGQVHLAVDYVVNMVKISQYTDNAETDDKALAWLNAFDVNDSTLRDEWIKTVVRYYNGCPPGGGCWSARYSSYDDGLTQVLSETNGPAFWLATPECPGATGTTKGAIDAHYRAIGGCNSVVGAPLTDELVTRDGYGRYNVFQFGSIYWTAQTGAFEVHGMIRDAWRDTGWESGPLGYPVSDEYAIPGGRRNDFQHGSISWDAATTKTTVVTTPGVERR
jgi:hypothetical protein